MKTYLRVLLCALCLSSLPAIILQAQTDSENPQKPVKLHITENGDTVRLNIDDNGVDISIQVKDKKGIASAIGDTIEKIIESEIEEEINETEEEIHEHNYHKDIVIEEEKDFSDEGALKSLFKNKKKKNLKTRFLLLDLGWNGLLYDGKLDLPVLENGTTMELKAKSVEANLHLIQQRLNLIQHKLFLKYGLTYGFNNYRFEKNIWLQDSPTASVSQVEVIALPSREDGYKKVKLTTSTLYVPLMLSFESNAYKKGKSFNLGVGGYMGIVTGGHLKYKTGNNEKHKEEDGLHLNRLSYGLLGEIGYGRMFNFYAKYALTELFKESERPATMEYYPISVGLNIIGF
ncbi:MAG: outer membrane beta-barrel protein [Sphingobacteriales bacterium]|nr:outer membrane beta-barrel protein [Sphingobacteriales bacterium]